jgi:3-hydroxyisobutyrate dehydrogenase-like beta-hydroxyacid dehydrogenase
MCKNLAEKAPIDSPLLLHNRSLQRAHDLCARLDPGKAEVATDLPAAVARADVIFTCLSVDAVVQDTVEGMLAGGDVAGKLFVDCSTVHPRTSEALAAAAAARGASFVAAPVFGAPAAAEAAQLVAVLAGPRDAVARARPYFTGVTARAELDFSDRPYAHASTLKVLGNTFILNMTEQLAEAHVVAEKSGLGTDTMHRFIEAFFPGPYTAYSARMLGGDYYGREEPLFAVDLARKDAGHAKDLAASAGVRLHNVETADAHLAKLREHAGPSGDLPGIYGVMREESGLPFENGARGQ